MYMIEHQISWTTAVGNFTFRLSGGIGTLTNPDGQVVELSMHDWSKIVAAIGHFDPVNKEALLAEQVKPKNAGAPWDSEQDQKLVAQFSKSISLSALAMEFGRTPGAIKSRLQKLGLVD